MTAIVHRPMEPRLEPHRAAVEAIYAETWTHRKPGDPDDDWHRTFSWWRSVHAVRLLVDAGFTITGPSENGSTTEAQA